jgi:hypothetical protein
MPKFRKKPVEIEAIKWEGSEQSVHDVMAFCNSDDVFYVSGPGDAHSIEIQTLEGRMTASEGDWIIRGVKGELYPCKPDIFAATYEPVD